MIKGLKAGRVVRCPKCNKKPCVFSDFGCWCFYCITCDNYSKFYGRGVSPDKITKWEKQKTKGAKLNEYGCL